MPTQTSSSTDPRPRPRRRRHIAGAIGAAAGTSIGVALVLLATAAGAHQAGLGEPRAVLDATHLPPLLTIPGEPVELRYDVHCLPAGGSPAGDRCDARGSVFVRFGMRGAYRELPLRVDETTTEGRYVAALPSAVAEASDGVFYYAVIESETAQMSMVLPAGGPRSPQRSMPMDDAIRVALGAHLFGATRAPDARVFAAAWGDGPAEVGLEGGRNVTPVGASSFDVDGHRRVHVLDEVHRRVLRRSAEGSGSATAAVSLAIDGTIADLAVGPDGTTYVLESARAERGPVVRAFGAAGEARGAVQIAERTASQIRVGPGGPIVLEHPSSQWVSLGMAGQSLSDSAQPGVGRAGRLLPGGGEVVVLRWGAEVRVVAIDANGIRRSWRVTSATPMAEVQLAEPMGSRLLLVVRMYTDDRDEFAALVLGSEGLIQATSLDSADWAETAPLSRFRLEGSSLYQLGSTPGGAFVDRYDLEVG